MKALNNNNLVILWIECDFSEKIKLIYLMNGIPADCSLFFSTKTIIKVLGNMWVFPIYHMINHIARYETRSFFSNNLKILVFIGKSL
jgi:hypothetical protein